MTRAKEFKLPVIISIQNVTELKKQFIDLLETGKSPWTVDWSACQKCDLAALQVMVAFVKEAERKGGEVRFTGPLDPNLSQSIELANFLTIKGNRTVFFDQLKNGGVVCESR
jgi:anti-anti-sigma regulatory factor